MYKILFVVFSLFASSFLTVAKAVGWEETKLVTQSDSGGLVYLEYASEGPQEEKGIRLYMARDKNGAKTLAECSYRDEEKARFLTCSVFDGKPVRRRYRAQPLGSVNQAQVQEIYRKHVGNGLQASAGGLEDIVFVCAEGCSKDKKMIISVTCAECGMEEWWCYERYKKKPARAVVRYANEINVRGSPSMKGGILGTLHDEQTVRVISAQDKCVEIGSKEGLRVGRWINVQISGMSSWETGWVFDVYVEYEY